MSIPRIAHAFGEPTASHRCISHISKPIALAVVVVVASACIPGPLSQPAGGSAPASPVTLGVDEHGSIQGRSYQLELPRSWNGLVIVTVAGPAGTGAPPLAHSAALADQLLANGFGLASVAARHGGWAVRDTADDQAQFAGEIKRRAPRANVLVTGYSYTGTVAAAAVELHPSAFAGSVPFCAALADAAAIYRVELDMLIAFTTLLAPSATRDLDVVSNESRTIDTISRAFDAAKTTSVGRARLSLVAALGDYSGWVGGDNEPTDPEAILDGQLTALRGTLEANLDRRAAAARQVHGSPIGNTAGYAAKVAVSQYRSEVRELYRRAGINLDEDIARLDQVRMAGSAAGDEWMRANYAFTGALERPVLAVDGTGDDWLTPSARVYRERVTGAGRSGLLRMLWIHRPGHCAFSDAEQLAALKLIAARINSGTWPLMAAAGLDAATPGARFVEFSPPPFP